MTYDIVVSILVFELFALFSHGRTDGRTDGRTERQNRVIEGAPLLKKTRTRNVHKERSMTKGTLLMKISLVMKDKKVYERQEQQRKHMTHDM